MKIIILVGCLLVLALAAYDYSDQQNWPGACTSGSRQSPINIVTSRVKSCPKARSVQIFALNKPYTQSPPTSDNLFTNFTLSTIQLDRAKMASRIFRSKQFHFHRQSEHTINGKNHSLQLHIVHEELGNPSSLAVLGILFQVQAGDFSDPFDNWNLNTTVDRNQYFPIDLSTPQSVYYYEGSLTTPSHPTPCDQVVSWFVDSEVIPIKQSSYDEMVKLIYSGSSYGNWRYVQDINNRTVFGLGKQCRGASRSLGRRRN